MHPHTGVGGGAGAAPHAAPAQPGYTGNPGAATQTATGGAGYAANPGAGPGGNPGIGPGAGTPAPDAAGARPGVSLPAPAGELSFCTSWMDASSQKTALSCVVSPDEASSACVSARQQSALAPCRRCMRSGCVQFPGRRRPLLPARWFLRALFGQTSPLSEVPCPGQSWVPCMGTQPGLPGQTPGCARAGS